MPDKRQVGCQVHLQVGGVMADNERLPSGISTIGKTPLIVRAEAKGFTLHEGGTS